MELISKRFATVQRTAKALTEEEKEFIVAEFI